MKKIRLIQKVLEGKADWRERAELDALMERDAMVRQDYEDLKLLMHRRPVRKGTARADDRAWHRIEGEIARLKVRRKRAMVKMVGMTSIAATLFVVAGWTVVLQRAVDNNETLLFDDRPVTEVLRTVKKKNGFSFQVSDVRALDDRFSGTFFRGATADEIGATLSLATGYEIRVEAN